MGKEKTVTKRQYHLILVYVLVFFMLIMGIAVAINIKNTINLRSILTESVKSQLISTSLAAREMLDVEAFINYQDVSVTKTAAYQKILEKLRSLANSVDAKYIYAFKRVGNEYIFIFDTDTEVFTPFQTYELSPVYLAAFAGHNSAGIMNVVDEYGSFNSGAVPIMHNGAVVGIIGTDIEDAYLQSSYNAAVWNAVLLTAILLITMGLMFVALMKLLQRIRQMQEKLRKLALYDNITGLPNRQYLMEHLVKLTSDPQHPPFALFFIDLDNFKKVNDNAGHDAGDELLHQIGRYLDENLVAGKSFRPAAGKLNIAARVGGDEFIQVVYGIDNAEAAAEAAERLLDGFKNANLSRHVAKYNVGLSIGVALYPHDSENYHNIIKYADVAMYNAKRGGKNQYRVYTDEMGQEKL